MTHYCFARQQWKIVKQWGPSFNNMRMHLGSSLIEQKPPFFFTKNTSGDMRRRIQNFFQVPEVKIHEKCLSLPSFVGRSKVTSFSELKGRVWRRMNGWKEKLLSQMGREVLIKAVA